MTPDKKTLQDYTALSNLALAKAYQAGFKQLPEALHRLSPDQLQQPFPNNPHAGEMSCIELLGHLMDAEIAFVHRMRRIAAEHRPLLIPWKEADFIHNRLYDNLHLTDILAVIRSTRHLTSQWLLCLPDHAFDRVGIHSEQGEQSLKIVVAKCVWHTDHHLLFLAQKTALLWA